MLHVALFEFDTERFPTLADQLSKELNNPITNETRSVFLGGLILDSHDIHVPSIVSCLAKSGTEAPLRRY